MSTDTDLEQALDRVCEAARTHLRAVREADGDADDDSVWSAFVALNNATLVYDQMLEDAYGEVTPWEVTEQLDEDEEDVEPASELFDGLEAEELRISVRQRRDYTVPRIEDLLAAGGSARTRVWSGVDDARGVEPVRSVGEAVYELLHAGGGSLGGLDIPELVPQSGLVLVNVVDETLGPDDLAAPPHAADELFALPDAPLIFSLYEPMYSSQEEAERAVAQQAAEEDDDE